MSPTADNVNVTPGSGVIIATRDAGGGIEVQRVIPNTWNGSVATDVSAANPMPNTGTLKDGVTTNLATVAQFHNADNQAPGGTAFGLLTGGVAQLLNAAGNLDRQRETGQDGISSLGIATGAAQFAMQFSTTDVTDNLTAGTARVFTPALMSGTINGVAWSVQAGSVLSLDSGASQEYVLVTAVTSTTFTATTAKAHNGTGTAFPITGFVYNQERDAAGELDGASGAGTAVATEYEYNSGGPGNSNYDRARNLQGKGVGTTTITSGGGSASTSVVLAAVTGLQPGQPLFFANTGGASLTTGNAEVVYVARNYVAGATTVPLASPLVGTHANGTSVFWDTYVGPVGPGLTGFLPTGVGIEESVVYDPASGLYYLERASTADGVSGQNVVVVGPGLYNGATLDRQRGNLDNIALIASAAYTTTQTAADQTNYNHKGVIVTLNVSSAGTGSITLEVDYKDPVSGTYLALLTGAAVTTATSVQYTVYPGATVAANAAVSMPLPRTWRVKVVANNANTITYSVGAALIL